MDCNGIFVNSYAVLTSRAFAHKLALILVIMLVVIHLFLYVILFNSKMYRRIRVEKHVTMYSTRSCIILVMLHLLGPQSISLKLCGEGTNVNTGRKSGVIVLLEKYLQNPIQWLICQLYANELPLRHLFQHFDGYSA